MGEEKTCFVIAPIGEPGSDTRKRSDQVLKHVIAPAVEPRGYKTERADQIAEPGMITPQVIDRVRDSDVVVADLAGRNPNVFYELAIRHAEKKPLIHIIAAGEDIPFDVRDVRTISVDIHDLDSVDEARQAISSQIDAIESGDFQMNTPISVAMDLRAYRTSDDLESRALADVLEGIGQLKALVVAVERRLARVEPVAGEHESTAADFRDYTDHFRRRAEGEPSLTEREVLFLYWQMGDLLRRRFEREPVDPPQEGDDGAEGQR